MSSRILPRVDHCPTCNTIVIANPNHTCHWCSTATIDAGPTQRYSVARASIVASMVSAERLTPEYAP